jgi:hypothetical protein
MMNKVFRLLPLVILTSALGACGTSGSTGETGAMGVAGAMGANGAAGANGTNGSAGANGTNGSNGTNGTNGSNGAASSNYLPGNLLVSRAAFDPTFNITGMTLPYNANAPAAITNPIVVPASLGNFSGMFTIEGQPSPTDGNFGVTAEAYLDQWEPGATSAATSTDITAQAAAILWNFSTSFASKSELALNVSLDKTALTFMGYNAAINQVDLSNSDTPGLRDSTNTDTATPTYRTVAQLNFADNSLSFTPTNAYSGNNGRAAVLANGMYYIVGNAGNGSGQTAAVLDSLSMSSGVQSIAPNSSCFFTQVIGGFIPGTAGSLYTAASCGLGSISAPNKKGDQFGFSITTLPSAPAADKTGKDLNLRGLFVGPDGTMYVSKGSGGNGVNTVYQVGAKAALANGGKLPQNAAITILPGFPQNLATNLPAPSKTTPAYPSAQTAPVYPFGMWVPSTNTSLMFVADEGDGVRAETTSDNGSGGLWVYQNQGGTWTKIAYLTAGLNLGQPYTVADKTGKFTGTTSYTTTPDGLRNITGQVNSDGSFTIYATTSAAGNSLGATFGFDAGADSNQLVKINLSVSGSTVTSTGFTLMQTAPYGQALRGVAMVPTL